MVETVTDRLDENAHILAELLPALQHLDALLEAAAAAVVTAYGAEANQDRFRGLYIGEVEVQRLLARDPGEPLLWHNGTQPFGAPASGAISTHSRLAYLKRTYGLSHFDVDALLIALAPELDRRYERLYAYLQDHVGRHRPGVDLVLNLLCPDAPTRLLRRAHFNVDAPLIRHGLLRLSPEPGNEQASLLAHSLIVDEQIVHYVLHQDGLDARLASFCALQGAGATPNKLRLPAPIKRTLPALLQAALREQRPVHLYFRGPAGAGKQSSAAAVAAQIGRELLVVDLGGAATAGLEVADALRLVFRHARLYGAISYIDGVASLWEETYAGRQARRALAQEAHVVILAGEQPLLVLPEAPTGMLQIDFAMPGFEQRRRCWRQQLSAAGMVMDDADLDTLAGRFRLLPAQIAAAVAVTTEQMRLQAAGHDGVAVASRPSLANLFAAARAQSGLDLGVMARKIEPTYTWDDIVLPGDTLAQLQEICRRVIYRQQVLGEWGFGQKLSLGKGINALFSGPSGTGKTMAAEIIAGELGLDLYKIDLSGVVSKYIGETEKNLDGVFRAAENANAILFFDEADALFGKRSAVRDSHDRYANIEISYLLQKMEEYDGISILATNLRQNLDESFIRRLALSVHFPFPDAASRYRIWQGIWPSRLPLDGEVNLGELAQQFRLSGGNIKNVALAAAFLAAEDGGPIAMSHVLQAVRREYQKMGKTLSDSELGALLNDTPAREA